MYAGRNLWSYLLFKADSIRAGWSGLPQFHFDCPEGWRFYSPSGHLLHCLTTVMGGRGGITKKYCLFVAIPYI